MKADVAILIVTYNSEDEIAACIGSVIRERRSVSQQIIVVDNKSSDGTVQVVQNFEEVKLVLPGSNLGFAKGVNLAARQADADYVLLLNPDTTVCDHAIDILVDFARKNPHYGLYGGRTLTADGRLEPSSCWGLPSLWSMSLFAFGITTLAPRNRWLDPESLGGWARDTVREVGVITGCLLLVSRKVWDQLGGLDERFFMYGEDTDFSLRAWKAGYRPVICPDAQIVHEVGKSSSTPLHKALLLYRGKSSYVRRRWTGWKQSMGLKLLLLGVALRATAGLLFRGKNKTWQDLWRQRATWIGGYG